ncbi:MxaK protein [Candidatus Methylospira mobilis]|nr:MxaK protein [Candidatus Methylospira mobilis]WNV03318.1 MxaK protein [Candidatus Methylospira mobilis]
MRFCKFAGWRGLALLITVALSVESFWLWRLTHINHRVHDASSEVSANDDPYLRFAKSWRMARDGEGYAAIREYALLSSSDDALLRERVNYNIGTLYLEQADALWQSSGLLEFERVTALLTLAKQYLIETLRMNPQNTDARFNLEYAGRITPPPREAAAPKWQGTKSSVFSTLPGLPGGGP